MNETTTPIITSAFRAKAGRRRTKATSMAATASKPASKPAKRPKRDAIPAIQFDGLMMDGTPAPTFKAWLADRRKHGMKIPNEFRLVGMAASVATVKDGSVLNVGENASKH